ncbi:hypothetical protein B9T33_01935 [Acinetobacter sp. ANC 5054]|uniref:hypothetical protein n=1 Tax=Acinetobacter sp. ANC 5054 TaxID=1977877 RepID=UPI000A3474CE|nr:hypothetical protein [Acinetobacter sp. ANC 5054]OTG84566.1 hypothetical protein B9T33_01935 [Acinetobacter sp. ANC 5054]
MSLHYILPLSFIFTFAGLTGCQTLSKTSSTVSDKVMGMLGKEKAPEVNQKGTVDISKSTQQQLENLLANMPKNQWVYIENDQQGTSTLKNKSNDNFSLSLKLNCKIATQRPTFSLTNKDDQEILKAHDSAAGQIQILLDNKNYGNPFELTNHQKFQSFKTALAQAKVIKIFNASKLYTFQNNKAELLTKPVSCRDQL